MVKMRMGNKYVVDQGQFREGQIGNTRAGVDQDVMVEQHGGGTQVPAADAATTA
jgi:hypothetical protein